MLIDWFTVAAQAINFLILVWLLKRYLYQPVIQAIDEREKRIAGELADAAKKQKEALTERDTYALKNEKFEQQREKLMLKAQDIANSEQQRLINLAQQTAELLRVKHQQNLAKETTHFKQVLADQAKQEVFSIARQTLNELATTSLEQQVSEVFIRRLHELDDTTKTTLADAIASTSQANPALLRSAFELTSLQRAAIHNAINVAFSADVVLKFSTNTALVSGIELSASGQKLVWSIDDYLTSLEQSVDRLLQEKSYSDSETKLNGFEGDKKAQGSQIEHQVVSAMKSEAKHHTTAIKKTSQGLVEKRQSRHTEKAQSGKTTPAKIKKKSAAIKAVPKVEES